MFIPTCATSATRSRVSKLSLLGSSPDLTPAETGRTGKAWDRDCTGGGALGGALPVLEEEEEDGTSVAVVDAVAVDALVANVDVDVDVVPIGANKFPPFP